MLSIVGEDELLHLPRRPYHRTVRRIVFIEVPDLPYMATLRHVQENGRTDSEPVH